MGKPGKTVLLASWFMILVFVVSQLTGQFYPFSKFPMYSSFPDHTNLFYLTDGNDQVLPTLDIVGIDGPRFKQVIEHHAEKFAGSQSPETLSESARESLIYLLQASDSATLVKAYGSIKVWELAISVQADTLATAHQQIAVWP